MMPMQVQRQRARGWKMPDNTVYVGRPTIYGNPFEIGVHGDAARCVELYRISLLAAQNTLAGGYLNFSRLPEFVRHAWGERHYTRQSDLLVFELVKRLPDIQGRNLACWCGLDEPCHRAVLLEMANPKEVCHAH